MVMMSYWPPLVVMSVVTFWRNTFSSIVTHCSWMSGLALVKSSVSFCMRIMSLLFTVAMVRVSADADDASAMRNAPAITGTNFMDVLPLTKRAFALFVGNYSRWVNVCQVVASKNR